MASSASKRRKTDEALVELHRGSYLSQRALAGVLKYVRDNGLPDNISRSSQYRANENIVANESNAYGKVLRCIDMPLESGGNFENWVCCPGPFLYSCCKSSAPVRELLRRSLQAHPCSLASPWHIILYFDGISPRDPLAKGKDYRGVDAVYWSFAEFDNSLGNEDAWFTLNTARCAKIKSIPGGIGQCIKMILKEVVFNTAGGFNFETSGVTVDVSENGDATSHATIVAQLSCVIGDEEALRELHMNKGHAGSKPCALCRNVLNRKFDYLRYDASGIFVTDACLDASKIRKNDDATIITILERLRPDWEKFQRGEFSDGEYKTITQHKGWNFHPEHIALDPGLRYLPASFICFDWMHIYFVGGIFDREVKALLGHAQFKHLCNASDLHTYFMKWTWPSKHHSAACVWETGELQAGASEELSTLPVLCRYLRQVVAKHPSSDPVAPQIASMLALQDAVDLIITAARRLPVTTAQIESAIVKHLRCHQDAYGEGYWVYKHHMATHLAAMFEKHGSLSCFVQERKHKFVKRFAKDHMSKKGPEKALMVQLTAQHAHDLKTMRVSTGLVDPTKATQKLLNALTRMCPGTQTAVSSIEANTDYGRIRRGDIVLLGSGGMHAAVQVWFHVKCDDGESQVLVQQLATKHVNAAEGYSRHIFLDDTDPVLMSLTSLKTPVIYRKIENDITCIWPVEYKSRCC